jgi:hypothetical protein
MYAYGMGGGDASEEPDTLEMAPAAPAEPAPPAAMEVQETAEEPAEKEIEPSAVESLDMAEPLVDEQRQPYQAETIREPAATSPPFPTWLVTLLALFAIVSGGLAFFLRWQSERRWKTTRKK